MYPVNTIYVCLRQQSDTSINKNSKQKAPRGFQKEVKRGALYVKNPPLAYTVKDLQYIWDGGQFAFNCNNGYTFTLFWHDTWKCCRIFYEKELPGGAYRLSQRLCGRGNACRISVESSASLD